MWRSLFGKPGANQDIVWERFAGSAYEKARGFDDDETLMVALFFSPVPLSKFEAMTEAKRRIANTKRPKPVSWLSAGIEEWVLDLNELKASEESVRNVEWLHGTVVLRPELELRRFELPGYGGGFDSALTVYITPETVGERFETSRVPVSSYESRWEIVRPLPSGGQGKVWVVRDKKRCESRDQIRSRILLSIADLAKAGEADRLKGADELISAIERMREGDVSETQGVLKVLHTPEAGRERAPEIARERMTREIKVMSDTSHSGLLRILESDHAELWYVSEYHRRGTLSDRQSVFRGNVGESLRAMRNIVEGVAVLHGRGFVHRDIKPDNIFLSADNRLVLGDFGLVYREQEGIERISKTLDNVGSWDWMPEWAKGSRPDEVTASFDVFSLGKTLWWMVSGQPVQKLKLWYFNNPDRADLNVEELFPGAPWIHLLNPLLAKCVVEHERECLKTAADLLVEIDKCLAVINNNADVIADGVERTCKVCGLGRYKLIVDRSSTAMHNLGFTGGGPNFRVFKCGASGHIQFFHC